MRYAASLAALRRPDRYCDGRNQPRRPLLSPSHRTHRATHHREQTLVSETYDYDLVCIGSGPAGQRAAVQAAKLGRRAAVVERRGSLGGVCLDTGTIPSKTFREAVLWTVASAARSDGALDGPPSRPTAEALLARVQEVVSREAAVIANQLRRNGVDVLRGDASFKDPHRIVVHAGDAW